MNIRALQVFQAVIREGSVSGAARQMNMSQPAVSRLIALLEAELRLPLFRRERQRLHLTAEGAAFVKESRRILASLQEIPRIADEIRAGRRQRLRVVTMPRTATSVVAPAVARFSMEHPEVKVSLDMRAHRDLDTWVNGREYDMGFGNVPVTHRAAVGTPMVRTALEVLMPASHRLASRDLIRLEDLAGEPMVQQFPGLLLRGQVDALLQTSDVRTGHEVLTSSSYLQQHLVAGGAGVAIIDRLSTLTMNPALVVSRPLETTRWVVFGAIRHRDSASDEMEQGLMTALRARLEECALPGSIEIVAAKN